MNYSYFEKNNRPVFLINDLKDGIFIQKIIVLKPNELQCEHFYTFLFFISFYAFIYLYDHLADHKNVLATISKKKKSFQEHKHKALFSFHD